MELKYIVSTNDTYQTVHHVLLNKFKLSTRLLNKLIKTHNIYLNSKIADTRENVFSGDIVMVNLNYDEDNSNIIPHKMNLKIVYEDEWFLVIDKPSGIPIHPSMLYYENSLSNGVKFYFDSIGLYKKIRPVNRLDLNTSGLVVFAKNEYIQEQLSLQMKESIFQKEYICFVQGILSKKSGIIDQPIARKANSIIERCISNEGKPSVTEYTVLKEFNNYSKVQCNLLTGRTHQIRVHFSSIGHPLLGDTLYGIASDKISRQALHSYKISMLHPITREPLVLIADLPGDMKNLEYIKK